MWFHFCSKCFLILLVLKIDHYSALVQAAMLVINVAFTATVGGTISKNLTVSLALSLFMPLLLLSSLRLKCRTELVHVLFESTLQNGIFIGCGIPHWNSSVMKEISLIMGED